jgi:AbrB family looped-hinge helix DNA binding protein
MATATMTSKGQVTIPKEVRDALRLETGHRIAFQVRGDGIVEMRPENVDLMSLRGIFKPSVKGVTLKDMKEAIRRGATGD